MREQSSVVGREEERTGHPQECRSLRLVELAQEWQVVAALVGREGEATLQERLPSAALG